jgi:hypothetical protein
MIERRGALRVLLVVALTLAPFAPTEAAAPAITGSCSCSTSSAVVLDFITESCSN